MCTGKRFLAMLLCLVMVLSLVPTAFASDAGPVGQVTLSIEKRTIGKGDLLPAAQVDLYEGDTPWDVLKREMDAREIPYTATVNEQFQSVYISSIDGDAEFDYSNMSGWMYQINGVFPDYGMSNPAVSFQAGDVMRVRFTAAVGSENMCEDLNHPLREHLAALVAEFRDELILNEYPAENEARLQQQLDEAQALLDSGLYATDSTEDELAISDMIGRLWEAHDLLEQSPDAMAAMDVDSLIDAIGQVTLDKEAKIQAARKAYDALTPAQKALVTRLQVLVDAEAALKQLKDDAAMAATVKITLSLEQYNEYSVLPREQTVSAALSDRYGYTDSVQDEVSALDALILAHQLVYGDAYKPETKDQYLTVTDQGFITRMMEQETSDVGFAVNGFMPNDGVLNPAYNSYTAYSLNQTALQDGDNVQFFFYHPDGYYGEIYSRFQQGDKPVTELTAKVDEQISLAVKGYSYMYEGCNAEIKWKPVTDLQVCTIIMDGDNAGHMAPISGAVTDEEGNVPLSFSQEGTYYLALTSDPEYLTFVIPQVCKVTVEAAEPDPTDPDPTDPDPTDPDPTDPDPTDPDPTDPDPTDPDPTDPDPTDPVIPEDAKPYAPADDAMKAAQQYILRTNAGPIVDSVGGEWAVIGLARSGAQVPQGYYEGYLQRVEAFVKERIRENETLHRVKSTENSRIIVALTAIGQDPTKVAGHDLTAGLTDMKFLQKQGINGPIWALIALDTLQFEIPENSKPATQVTREKLLQCILDAQHTDGGWSLSARKDFPTDADMTGMAMQALAPYRNTHPQVKAALRRGLERLSQLQGADGSFGSSEAAVQTIVALTAMGVDPHNDPRFVKNGVSAVEALCRYALEDGSFRHVMGQGSNIMATEQALYGLAAYSRFVNDQVRLYDMSDAKVKVDPDAPDPEVPDATEPAEKPSNPTTGDESQAALLTALAVTSLAAMAALLVIGKKYRTR